MTSDDLFYKCFSTQGTYIQPLFVLDFCTRWQNCRKHVEEHQMYLQDVESSHARNYLLCSIRDFLGLHLCRHIFPCFRTKRVEWGKNTPAQEANVADTSNNSYGTETDEVRHDRNCSSRTLYIDRIEDLRRSSDKNFLGASQKNFHTSTNAEDLQDLNARTS